MQCEGNVWKNGHETDGFFCMTTPLIGGQKVPCQAQCDSFGASAIFPGFVIACLFPVSKKKCSERTVVRACQEVAFKAMRALTEVSENGAHAHFQILYECWQKCVCVMSKGTTTKEILCK
jgi:hypothetical protein